MAIDRSGLAAQTYLLPQPQQQPQPVQPTFEDGVVAMDGLQHVRGQTEEYYKKVGALKAFMQSVNKNLGIDVRVPDLSRPESVKLNQIYQDALADILAQGNMLKQSSGINTMLMNRGDVMTPAYYDKPAAEAQWGQEFFSRQLEPSVVELNNKLQMPSYTKEEFEQKEAARKAAIKYWENIRDTNPEMREYAEYQLRGISPTTQGMFRPFAPQRDTAYDRKFGRQVRQSKEWIKKLINFQYGAHDSFEPDLKNLVPVGEEGAGKPFLVSKEFSVEKIGGRQVVRWELNPTNGKLYLLTKDKDGVARMEVSGGDMKHIIRELSGVDTTVIEAALEEMDANDELGQIDKSKILTEESKKKREEILFKAAEADTQKMKETIKQELGALEPGFRFLFQWTDDDEKTIGQFRLKRRKDKIEIVNIATAINTAGKTLKEAQQEWSKRQFWPATPEGIDALVTYLIQQGAHLEYFKDRQPAAPGTESADNNPLGLDLPK